MITKYENNPVIRPSDVKPSLEGYRVLGAFNPGAVAFGGEILLLLRVAEGCEPREGYIRTPTYAFENGTSRPTITEFGEDDPDVVLKDTRGVVYKGRDYLSTASHIRLARSTDGFNFTVDPDPFIYPEHPSERYGVEDARAVFIDGRYYINYTAVSGDSWATALAVTDDFRTIERKGLIFHPENKDVTIFPEKIGGKYAALHRPNNSGFGPASIWYAESPDLIHWGNHQCIVRPRDNEWESLKIGGGAPPVRTPEGWLTIYHGKGKDAGYSLFCLLLDLNQPNKIVRRGAQPILTPTEPYETGGFYSNVVFSNGIVEKDGRLLIYYGAADDTSCVAMTTTRDLLSNGF
jgi:predicted GH43/DUF377 family glycosyl hydrolase